MMGWLLSFLRRHPGRLVFYASLLAGSALHSMGQQGLGVGIFVLACLTLAQKVDDAAKGPTP